MRPRFENLWHIDDGLWPVIQCASDRSMDRYAIIISIGASRGYYEYYYYYSFITIAFHFNFFSSLLLSIGLDIGPYCRTWRY